MVTAYASSSDHSAAEASVSPALDARAKDGPRRNQGGVIITEEDALAGTLKGQRGKGGGGIGPEETLVAGTHLAGPEQTVVPDVAAPLEASDGHHGYSSPRGDGADNLIAGPLTSPSTGRGGSYRLDDHDVHGNHLVPEVAPALISRYGKGTDSDASDAMVAVPISADALRGEGEAKTPSADAEGNVRLRDPGLGVGEAGDPAFTIAASGPGAVAAPLSHGSNPNSNAAGRRREDDENLAIAFHATQTPISEEELTPALGKGSPGGTASVGVLAPTIGAGVGSHAGGHPGAEEYAEAVHAASASVRRLTPRECERLQALPDDWTRIAEDTPDSRRYAGLGDAVTASVGRWIGERIIAAELGASHRPTEPDGGGGEVASTLKSQDGRGWSYDPEATYVVEDNQEEGT